MQLLSWTLRPLHL